MATPNWRIIGSVAAHHWFPDSWKEVQDIDILTPDKIHGTMNTRIETQWHDVAEEIIARNVDPVFVDANMLMTIKFSHAPWNVKWDKTMIDIYRFQQNNCVIIEDLVPRLRAVWKEIHGAKRVNLKQDVSEFFSHDAVSRKYPHELVHEMVAFNGRPMHESIRPDLNSVWCDRKMFDGLAYGGRLDCAFEEMCVVAIERMNLTTQSTDREIRSALVYAYKNLVTSMTTGWFTDFMILQAKHLRAHSAMQYCIPQIKQALIKLEKQ